MLNEMTQPHRFFRWGFIYPERILGNSFIPPPNRLHSKSVSFSLVFFLNIKIDLLVFGNTILQGGLCFVECVDFILFFTTVFQNSFYYYIATVNYLLLAFSIRSLLTMAFLNELCYGNLNIT